MSQIRGRGPRRSISGIVRQDPYLCGVWGRIHFYCGGAGIFQYSRILQRTQALPELPGSAAYGAAWWRWGDVFRPATRDVPNRLRRVRNRCHGAVPAPRRPSSLLQRLFQQDADRKRRILADCHLSHHQKLDESPASGSTKKSIRPAWWNSFPRRGRFLFLRICSSARRRAQTILESITRNLIDQSLFYFLHLMLAL